MDGCQMKKFEYKTIVKKALRREDTPINLLELFEELSDDGWEILSHEYTTQDKFLPWNEMSAAEKFFPSPIGIYDVYTVYVRKTRIKC